MPGREREERAVQTSLQANLRGRRNLSTPPGQSTHQYPFLRRCLWRHPGMDHHQDHNTRLPGL